MIQMIDSKAKEIWVKNDNHNSYFSENEFSLSFSLNDTDNKQDTNHFNYDDF